MSSSLGSWLMVVGYWLVEPLLNARLSADAFPALEAVVNCCL